MKAIHAITFFLVIIGGLNWLLTVFGADLATWGLPETVVKAVYVLVGVSALVLLFSHKKDCKMCGTQPSLPMSQ